MRFNLKANLSTLDELERKATSNKTQRLYSMKVEEVMRRYVPFESGTLADSAKKYSSYDKGEITYNTPYARRQYRYEQRHKAPQTDHWDRVAAKKHAAELEAYTSKLLGGK